MATPELVTVRDFTTSRYNQLVENLDTSLNDILARAEAAVQASLRRKLKEQTYTETWKVRGSNVLFVQGRPITALTSIKRRLYPSYTYETLDLSNVWYDGEAGYIETPFDLIGWFVEVTYTAGFAVLPEDIREAILMQAVLMSYVDLEVYGSGDSRPPGTLYFHDEIARLLDVYRLTSSVYRG